MDWCSVAKEKVCAGSCARGRRTVSIPMRGAVESLNVSVAAAVLPLRGRTAARR